MRQMCVGAVLALSLTASCQIQTLETKALSNTSQILAAMQFDANLPVTIRGRVSTLVWPEGTSGMVVIEADEGGEKYAFSTARVPDMAKQGFTRFAVPPGAELTVTGVLAASKAKIGPGLTAARADLITRADGSRAFDRARLP
jgi:hypothetical protein